MPKNYKTAITDFIPVIEQEISDKAIILDFINHNPSDVLLRNNKIAHMTSSSMIFNSAMNKVLMVYHNIYQNWAWTGGHADGDTDLLHVAMKEAKEETGLTEIGLLSEDIVSIETIPVFAHIKRGNFVSSHLHLNVTYGFFAEEDADIKIKPDENSGLRWIPITDLEEMTSAEPYMFPIYNKIMNNCLSLHSKEKK